MDLAADADMRADMGKAGRTRVASEYTWSAVVGRMQSALSDV
jgi:hypothetical protein